MSKLIYLTPFVMTFLIFSTGCSSSNSYVPEKMDTALNQKIQKSENENPDELIKFIGKSGSSITAEMEEKLKSTGIKLESLSQNLFTASGTASQIKETSMLDFITYLELFRNMDLK